MSTMIPGASYGAASYGASYGAMPTYGATTGSWARIFVLKYSYSYFDFVKGKNTQ